MSRKAMLPLLILTLILTAATACSSGGNSTTPPEANDSGEVSQPTTVAIETASDAASDAESEPTAETETMDAAEAGGLEATIIEEVASIERYRMRVTYGSQGTARDNDTVIEAAYSKEPPAESFTVTFTENGQPETITMILVDGVRYIQAGEAFIQTTDEAMNLHELTLIQPQDVDFAANFTQIGEEERNGRMTVHYQGGPDAVPTGGTAGDTFDVSGIASATIDLWIDQAEKFIVAMSVQIDGLEEDPEAIFGMHFEYFDFNSPDIVIAIPEQALAMAENTAESGDDSSAAAAVTPRNDLGKLLGFDLLVATGSQITAVTNQVVQVKSVYTLDEAVNLFQLQLPANGYTLLNAITPQAGEQVLMFQKDGKTATIQIKGTDEGSDWDVIIAP